jgi:hypothetical protein
MREVIAERKIKMSYDIRKLEINKCEKYGKSYVLALNLPLP